MVLPKRKRLIPLLDSNDEFSTFLKFLNSVNKIVILEILVNFKFTLRWDNLIVWL